MRDGRQHIFLVDDEPGVLKAIARTLEELGCKVSCFANAEECFKQLRLGGCDLLITDVKMPGVDGIELLTEVKRVIPYLPVVMITGYGDIPIAVRAVKMGATDFVEKPLDKKLFLQTIRSILEQNAYVHHLTGKALTRAELKVLRLIVDGKSNKEIARILRRSVRTVEDHRSHIMHKLDVDNVVDLVKKVSGMKLIDTHQ